MIDGSQGDAREGRYQRVVKAADGIVAGYGVSQFFQGVYDTDGHKIIGAHESGDIAGGTVEIIQNQLITGLIMFIAHGRALLFLCSGFQNVYQRGRQALPFVFFTDTLETAQAGYFRRIERRGHVSDVPVTKLQQMSGQQVSGLLAVQLQKLQL